MAIKDWPADERPREKLLSLGPQALTDAELLAIFLRTGVSGLSAVDLAKQLLSHFTSLRLLLEADIKQFTSQHGLGQAKYVQLQAVLEMSRRHMESTLKNGDLFTDSQTAQQFLKQNLRHHRQEVFAGLFLDNQHQLIKYEELFFGTINSASVYPREIVKKAIEYNAAALIIAHNHPSGNSEPSISDKKITERIKSALDLIDVRLLDHIIVGDKSTYSFTHNRLLM
jgi:DNA repair protein RadC